MIINPISYGGSGLMSEIIVTAAAGSTLDLIQNSVVLKTYTLGSTETQHTFVVKNVGEYTVKSTLGENIYSSNVLIETVGQYPVAITGKLYLYNLGDECESITGGWNAKNSNGSFTKNSTSFVLANGNINTNGLGVSVGKLIDLSKYTKLVTQWACELTGSSSGVDTNARVGFSPDASKGDLNMNPYERKDVNYSGLTEVNITSDAVGKYVTFTNYGYIKATVYKVWLE